MNNTDFPNILYEYVNWIKDNTDIRHINDQSVIITTPFLDSYNDHVEIIVYKKNSWYVMTDDGWTIANLNMKWVDVKSWKRGIIFSQILNSFWVTLDEHDCLSVECNSSNLWQKKHKLLQAIIAVWDMYVLSRENVFSIFSEEVELFFKSKWLFPSKNIKISWKSWFDHNINFIFNATSNRKELLLQVINSPQKDKIQQVLFSYNDISWIRDEADRFVIINDNDKPISNEYLKAFEQYWIIPLTRKDKNNLNTLLWSYKFYDQNVSV